MLLFNFFSAILRLPSNLFYDCCLLTRSRDSDPHPKAPYPLVFVCSSMEEAQINRNAWDIEEAQKVLRFASYYLRTWPSTWGNFAESEVCILASSHQQVSCVRAPHTVSNHNFGFCEYNYSRVVEFCLGISSITVNTYWLLTLL